MNRENIDRLVVQGIDDAEQVKRRANKLVNRLFPWPWWSKAKKNFSTQKRQEILILLKEDRLPSEILARLSEIEKEINAVL